MEQKNLDWKLGESFPTELLSMAYDRLSAGTPDDAIDLYKKAVVGITDDYILQILKNEMVLTLDEEGTGLVLSDDAELIEENKPATRDWKFIIKSRSDEIREDIRNIANAAARVCINGMRLDHRYKGNLLTPETDELETSQEVPERESTYGICNCVANAIINGFENVHVSHQHMIRDLEKSFYNGNVRSDIAKETFHIWNYFKMVMILWRHYAKYERLVKFLTENKFAEQPAHKEEFMCGVFHRLEEFTKCEIQSDYPDFKEKFPKIKEDVGKFLEDCDRYSEYKKYGTLPCSMDELWDAGWLSLDGLFFAANGSQNELLHTHLADDISNGEWFKENAVLEEGETPESWLEQHGWMKNFGRDFYGHFVRSKELVEQGYAFCPTEIQVSKLCKYVDKYYGGRFYTQPNSLVGYRDDSEETTARVRQMDRFALNKTFSSIGCTI